MWTPQQKTQNYIYLMIYDNWHSSIAIWQTCDTHKTIVLGLACPMMQAYFFSDQAGSTKQQLNNISLWCRLEWCKNRISTFKAHGISKPVNHSIRPVISCYKIISLLGNQFLSFDRQDLFKYRTWSLKNSDGSGTKNPGTGRIRVIFFRVPGGPGTWRIRTGRIRVK